jgi:hypothetical protein
MYVKLVSDPEIRGITWIENIREVDTERKIF